jgi:hypothetical protein
MWSNQRKGEAFVYRQDVLNGWVEDGADITSTYNQAMTGYSVSLSGDGTRMIVAFRNHPGEGILRGRVEIFHLEGDAWVSKFGWNGEVDRLRLGEAVAMSRSGNRAVATGITDGKGGVVSFEYVADEWVHNIEMTPPSGNMNADFGNAVAMSADGSVIAVGARKDLAGFPAHQNGKVVFYCGTTTSNCRPELLPVVQGEMFGSSISMSNDGTTVVVGYGGANGGIYTYTWDAGLGTWTVVTNIQRSLATSPGRSVALSDDGTRMVYTERGAKKFVIADLQ